MDPLFAYDDDGGHRLRFSDLGGRVVVAVKDTRAGDAQWIALDRADAKEARDWLNAWLKENTKA